MDHNGSRPSGHGQDDVLFDQVRQHLHTSVIGDVLDQMGCYHQFLPPGLRPIADHGMLVGRAMPVLLADEFGPPKRAFGRLTDALDSLARNEVYIATGGSIDCAGWGEILTVTAMSRGAAGAVIDGFHRDTVRVVEQRWPVFSRGPYGQDAGVRASVRDFHVPIEIARVPVAPGDLIVGDVDGVIVIPTHLAAEVIERAVHKVGLESSVLTAIANGMSSTDAFSEFGVL